MEKSVLMDRTVQMLIRELSNCIRLKRTKKSFALTSLITLENASMEFIAPLLTVKNKYKSNLFIIMHMMRISICFTIKLNFVLLI